MTILRLRVLFVAAFLALSTSFVVTQNLQRERILIVNGGDPASAFTRRVDIGLRRVFRSVENKTIRWDYMGTEAAADLATEAALGKIERRRVDKFRPTVIIAIGDDALEYVGKFYAGQPGISIVYAAITGNLGRYGFTRESHVTGIAMSAPYAAARDALLAVNENGPARRIRRIFHLTVDRGDYERWEDGTPTSDWAPLRVVGSRTVATFEAWKTAIEAAGLTADAVVTELHEGLRRSNADPSPASAREIVEWTEAHSAVPVLGLDVTFVEEGGLVAIGPSPYEEGRVAGQLALARLDGHAPPSILRARRSGEYVVALRRRAMLLRHFELPEIYGALAHASDQYYD